MDLKKERDKKIVRQQELVSTAKQQGRNLTEGEQREFDSLQTEVEGLQRQIDEAETRGAAAAGSKESPVDIVREIERERERVAEISDLCREFDLSPDDFIRKGTGVDEVRKAAIEELKKSHAPVRAAVTKDEGDKFRDAASDALLMRAGIPVAKAADGAGDFKNLGLKEMAIECLTREGRSTMDLLRMHPDELYNELSRQFFNPTSAFPAILDNTAQKSIVHLYNTVPTTFQHWTTKGSLKDFKETKDHEYLIGGSGDFLKVPENGELKADKPQTHLLPSRKLDTYGRSFSMSRQAFINDDIGFLTEVPGLYAAKSKRTIDKAVYTLLYSNEKIFDGTALFDAGKHNNLMASAGKPSQATIQAMILQMQKQTDPFGEAIYVTPKYVIVPVGYEFDLAVILHSSQITGSSNNDINPLYNYPLSIVQTPILNALAAGKAVPWFMVSDPVSAKSVQVDYLNGNEMPTIRRMEAPGVLGFTWDIYLDWGITVRDFRGMTKNAGEIIA